MAKHETPLLCDLVLNNMTGSYLEMFGSLSAVPPSELPFIRTTDLVRCMGYASNIGNLGEALRFLESSELLEFRAVYFVDDDGELQKDRDSAYLRILAAGLQRVQRHERFSSAPHERVMRGLVENADDYSDESDDGREEKFDSIRWTGETNRSKISETKRMAIIARLKELEIILDSIDLSQEEYAQAKSLLTASVLMAEAPLVPVKQLKETLALIAAIATTLALALQIASMLV